MLEHVASGPRQANRPIFQHDPVRPQLDPRPGLQEAADRREQRRLAGAVGADDARDPALRHVERDALEDVAAAVTRRDAIDSEQWLVTRGLGPAPGGRRGPRRLATIVAA